MSELETVLKAIRLHIHNELTLVQHSDETLEELRVVLSFIPADLQ